MCNCIEQANTALAARNTALDTKTAINTKTLDVTYRLTIPTRKINSKGKKAMVVFVTYCPLCGEKQ